MTPEPGSPGPENANPTLGSRRLILASASPRRRELLTALGLPFEVEAADIDETLLTGERAEMAAVRLARLKAEVVFSDHHDAIVLGADTVVIVDRQALGKPADAEEATAMLRALRGREHVVVTGIAIVTTPASQPITAMPATRVMMRDYTNVEIAASIAAGTPFDKAGAYAIQDTTFAPVANISGCYCNVVGLPLWSVHGLLEKVARLPVAPPDSVRPTCRGCPLARK